MDREAIKTYSYRISQATRSELVVIVYDIIRDYLKDAVSTSDNAVFKEKLHMAMRGIDQLITGLDMQYELSGNLYVLYNYMKRTVCDVYSVISSAISVSILADKALVTFSLETSRFLVVWSNLFSYAPSFDRAELT